jgi:hypothetical protein
LADKTSMQLASKFLFVSFIFLTAPLAKAEFKSSRVNLDDVEIKGENHNDGRVDLLRRDRSDISSIIQVRKDFRPEILQSLPVTFVDLD